MNEQKLNEVYEFIQLLKANGTFPYDVASAIEARFDLNRIPSNIRKAPRAAITAPTGGLTQDTAARTAINDIITALEELGLVTAN